jgi:hypothetical protein
LATSWARSAAVGGVGVVVVGSVVVVVVVGTVVDDGADEDSGGFAATVDGPGWAEFVKWGNTKTTTAVAASATTAAPAAAGSSTLRGALCRDGGAGYGCGIVGGSGGGGCEYGDRSTVGCSEFGVGCCATGVPHDPQNRAVGASSRSHVGHTVMAVSSRPGRRR